KCYSLNHQRHCGRPAQLGLTSMNDALNIIWTTVSQEFSDVAELSDAVRIVVRLFMAVLLGGLIGYEREHRRKAAGLRTHMMVSLGAAVFVLAPLESGMGIADVS